MKKLVTTVLFFLSFTLTSFSQLTPFTYRQCIEGTLKDNYQPAPCEITGKSTPASIWVIQVGAYRQNIIPIPGVMMIPYELNRYYLFSFQDVGKYKGSLFFSTREAALSFIQENTLDELFCQVFPVRFPFQDIVAYITPSSSGGLTSDGPIASLPTPNTRDTATVGLYSDENAYTINYTYHTVQGKDNLYQLSVKYGTTVDNIKRLNPQHVLDILTIGTVLRVK